MRTFELPRGRIDEDTRKILDTLAKYGIRLIAGCDYKKDILTEYYIEWLRKFGGHPALLFVEFGNEYIMQSEYLKDWFPEPWLIVRQSDDKKAKFYIDILIEAWFYTLDNAAANAIKVVKDEYNKTLLVSTAMADRPELIEMAVRLAPNVKIIGINNYRGKDTFAKLFTEWKTFWDSLPGTDEKKPLLYVSEFGGYFYGQGQKFYTSEGEQALKFATNWEAIDENSSANHPQKVCLGGLHHSFNERWEILGHKFQQEKPRKWSWSNEELFNEDFLGSVKTVTDKKGNDVRIPKKVYDTQRDVWLFQKKTQFGPMKIFAHKTVSIDGMVEEIMSSYRPSTTTQLNSIETDELTGIMRVVSCIITPRASDFFERGVGVGVTQSGVVRDCLAHWVRLNIDNQVDDYILNDSSGFLTNILKEGRVEQYTWVTGGNKETWLELSRELVLVQILPNIYGEERGLIRFILYDTNRMKVGSVDFEFNPEQFRVNIGKYNVNIEELGLPNVISGKEEKDRPLFVAIVLEQAGTYDELLVCDMKTHRVWIETRDRKRGNALMWQFEGKYKGGVKAIKKDITLDMLKDIAKSTAKEQREKVNELSNKFEEEAVFILYYDNTKILSSTSDAETYYSEELEYLKIPSHIDAFFIDGKRGLIRIKDKDNNHFLNLNGAYRRSVLTGISGWKLSSK